MVRLVDEIERATRMLPEVMRSVVMRDPGMVPKASTKIPPSTGKTVFTIATLDWITPYSALLIWNCYANKRVSLYFLLGHTSVYFTSLMVFFMAPRV